MNILLAQLKVSKDINENKKKVLDVINTAKEKQWVIFPEGMLSGYYPEESTFISSMDFIALEKIIEEIRIAVREKGTICMLGTVSKQDDKVFNTTLIFNANTIYRYNKCNLSTLDRNHFDAGSKLEVFHIDEIPFAVQMCRENAFPEHWTYLKDQGVKVIFHINNAVAKYDWKRKHLLISRAMENQLFVVSVNTVSDTGPLASTVIGPYGDVLYEAPVHEEVVHAVDIDLSEVMDDYKNQRRTDLVKVISTSEK